jgi:DNA topoisomerase-2
MTIVNLAQDYIGSNNMNLLMPNGQYGTRDAGGKDHASARYIFTELAPITRHMFNPSDDPLLAYQKDDGIMVEPEWFMPVLPLVLVNGAEGIGTGEVSAQFVCDCALMFTPIQVGARTFLLTIQST